MFNRKRNFHNDFMEQINETYHLLCFFLHFQECVVQAWSSSGITRSTPHTGIYTHTYSPPPVLTATLLDAVENSF